MNFGSVLSGILIDSLYPKRRTLQLKQISYVERIHLKDTMEHKHRI